MKTIDLGEMLQGIVLNYVFILNKEARSFSLYLVKTYKINSVPP